MVGRVSSKDFQEIDNECFDVLCQMFPGQSVAPVMRCFRSVYMPLIDYRGTSFRKDESCIVNWMSRERAIVINEICQVRVNGAILHIIQNVRRRRIRPMERKRLR